MGNLVYAPHYTCGGLMCDILNQTWGTVSAYGAIESELHQRGKSPGDSLQIFTDFNDDDLIEILKDHSDTEWIGTHCYPTERIIAAANRIVLVTTATTKSRIYRFARAYHHYFMPQWQSLQGLDLIDKARETAKAYITASAPVHHNKVYNLEFSDVVENTVELKKYVNELPLKEHIDRWQQVNSFLYSDFWNSPPALRYYEAEYEVNLHRYYAYQ